MHVYHTACFTHSVHFNRILHILLPEYKMLRDRMRFYKALMQYLSLLEQAFWLEIR